MTLPHRGRLAAIAIGPLLLFGPRALIASGLLWYLVREIHIDWIEHVTGLVVLAMLIAAVTGARRLGRRRADDLLIAAAGISAAAWFNFGFMHLPHGVHLWEQFHYFLGSRYYAELGYDGLYVASLADQADHAPMGRVPEYVRDSRNNQVVPTESLFPYMREV